MEYDPTEFEALCRPFFGDVQVKGLFGSPRYMAIHEKERQKLSFLLACDPLRVRQAVPRRVRQRLYDLLLARSRKKPDPAAGAITIDDFTLGDQGPERPDRTGRAGVEESLDLVPVSRTDPGPS